MNQEVNSILITTSSQGYIQDPRRKLARLFGYYMATNKHQTLFFKDRIVSLPYTYMQGIDDPNRMADDVMRDLIKILTPHYKQVDVLTEVTPSESTYVNVAIYATVIENDGTSYGLGNVVAIDPEGLGRIVEISNYGDRKRYYGRGK